jgi:mannosyltransferase
MLAVIFLFLFLSSMPSLRNMYTNPAYARADYRAMAARIQTEAHPNAGIILNAPNQWEVFTYYYPDDSRSAAVYPLPKGRSRPHPGDVEATLSDIVARHDRIYALFWGEAQRDPERLVERWLDEHAFKATDEWVGDVRFVMYAVPDEPATEMETAVHLQFGPHIQLNGYTVQAGQLAPGDVLQLTLFWQTAVPLGQRYKVFLHLVDAQGQLVSQRDSEPGGGLAITTTWQPDQVIVDNHGVLLPVTLQPGEYTLLLGLYDILDPAARLPILTEDNMGDAFPIVSFTIKGG